MPLPLRHLIQRRLHAELLPRKPPDFLQCNAAPNPPPATSSEPLRHTGHAEAKGRSATLPAQLQGFGKWMREAPLRASATPLRASATPPRASATPPRASAIRRGPVPSAAGQCHPAAGQCHAGRSAGGGGDLEVRFDRQPRVGEGAVKDVQRVFDRLVLRQQFRPPVGGAWPRGSPSNGYTAYPILSPCGARM